MKSFADLFKKYRLRAEFNTLSEFGAVLSEKGFICEESIFSHWQKGTRVPNNRQLILAMIELFAEREAMRTIDEANGFIASTGLGFLTEKEYKELSLQKSSQIPFQVPNEIAHFTGRKDLIKKIVSDIESEKVFLLHGPAGVGKTALAIEIGHLLRNKFEDGVLWYKVDSSNSMDILLSIAKLFGEDIHLISDIEVRASIVRTLLAKKKVLLIFDNVTKKDKLSLLLPNSNTSSVIFASQEKILPINVKYTSISVNNFTAEEVIALFERLFDKKYVRSNKKIILQIAEKVGFLPLAVNMVATYINHYLIAPQEYLNQLEEDIDLHVYKYEDKTLQQTISIGFNSLEKATKDIFLSLGIFEGKDFSLETVAYINKLPQKRTEKILQELLNISFIESSKAGRYRIHRLMRSFAREKINDYTFYLRAAEFYESQLILAQENKRYKYLQSDTENIFYIVKQCYEAGYWDQIITIWNPLEKFLSDTNEMKKLRSLKENIDTSSNLNIMQKALTFFLIIMLIYWLIINSYGLKTSLWNYIYTLFVTILPLSAGLIGVFRSRHWGLFKSNLGKAIFMISLGSLSWAFGNLIWSYYNLILKIELPYPSFSDGGFFLACPLWIFGVISLTKSTGAKFVFRNKKSKLFLLSIPFAIILFSYYFLIFIVKRSYNTEAPLHIFFDIYYPSMDIVILSLATIIFGLSINFFGGKYKISLFSILGGFFMMYLSDFVFSYLTSSGTYFNGGIDDLLFSFAFYLLAWGLLHFYYTPKRIIK